MKILLAIDGSEISEVAIRRLVDQTKAAHTEVRLLHVLDPYPERLAKKIGGCDSPDFTAAQMKQRALAKELLDRARARFQSAGFAVNASIREGDVRAAILEEARAWRPDLLVLGSRQRKGIWHFFSGSVSEDVSRDALCSVEIVRLWPRPTSILDTWPQGNAESFSETHSGDQRC